MRMCNAKKKARISGKNKKKRELKKKKNGKITKGKKKLY